MNLFRLDFRDLYRWLSLALMLIALTGVAGAQDSLDALAEPGVYAVGVASLRWTDDSRDGRFIRANVWYPAVQAGRNTAPDDTAAPYPLIVFVHGYPGGPTDFTSVNTHLASHGFVVIGASHLDDLDRIFVDRTLDILFMLDQLEAMTDEPLAGIVDLEHVGVMGWSMGGLTTLLMGGAHVDWPATQDAMCQLQAAAARCQTSEFQAEVEADMLEFGEADEQGLLFIPTDERIDAVAALAMCCPHMLGARGLQAADMPMLMMHGTDDGSLADYESEALFAFENYGADEVALISFVGANHFFPLDDPRVPPLLTAYFGLHLQGHDTYAEFLSEDAVNGIDDTVWGAYEAD